MAGWTVPPTDLILGDPNGVHIELIAAEAKITLYNAAGIPIMVLDGTDVFLGDPFPTYKILSTAGFTVVQLDGFQIMSGIGSGPYARLIHGGFPGEHPRLEILQHPITDHVSHQSAITSQTIDAPEYGGRLIVTGPTFDAHAPAVITLTSETTSATEPSADVEADLRVYGQSIGRGLVARISSTGDAATATTAETIATTLPAATYPAGRAYEVRTRGIVLPSAAGIDVTPRIRKGTTLAGTQLIFGGRFNLPVVGDRNFEWLGGFRTGAAAVTTELLLSAATTAGTAIFRGYATSPLIIEVHDVGAAADFTDLATLT